MSVGSSPLARGLLDERDDTALLYGIIPARAGFTAWTPTPPPPTSDHPRSRGVYAASSSAWGTTAGSSPLARGLRAAAHHYHQRMGIIPARAGFTAPRPEHRRRHPDHPRSRGVYTHSDPDPRLYGWIIPARAGFTGGIQARAHGARDHPRSRGVYDDDGLGGVPSPGSSPLARGLPFRCRASGCTTRIIPARAGFTRRPEDDLRDHRDHPRSRGVYHRRALLAAIARGSSPLARGLHATSCAACHQFGIIPARAGFTRHRRRRARVHPDHPRSRGVYARLMPAW